MPEIPFHIYRFFFCTPLEYMIIYRFLFDSIMINSDTTIRYNNKTEIIFRDIQMVFFFGSALRCRIFITQLFMLVSLRFDSFQNMMKRELLWNHGKVNCIYAYVCIKYVYVCHSSYQITVIVRAVVQNNNVSHSQLTMFSLNAN